MAAALMNALGLRMCAQMNVYTITLSAQNMYGVVLILSAGNTMMGELKGKNLI